MGWLDNMVLRSKLMLLTTILMVALVIMGLMGYKATSEWEADIVEVGEIRAASLIDVGTVRNGVLLFAIQVNRSTGLNGDPDMRAKMKNVSELMQKALDTIDRGMLNYSKITISVEEAEVWKKFLPEYEEWRKRNDDFKTNVIDALSKSSDAVEIESLFGKMKDHLEKISALRQSMQDKIQEVYSIDKKNIVNTSKNAKDRSSSYKQMFMMVALASMVLGILFAALIIRSITLSIKSSVTAIRDGAMQITSASDQVASSSSSLAQGASEQAASVEEVSATLEESTAINTQNTDNAHQADILAKNANDSAKAGFGKGEQLSLSMQTITQSAAKISGIIKTIDQIAFQTNLLALNAAVEAARAGEHGLGFAVVADEVRNLAQRAASAAKETSVIIEEVVEQIKKGNQIANSTFTSFKEIVEQSKKVSDLIGEISIAGKEQSEGMGQINQAMGQVDQVTQQVAANSEQAAAAAEELNAQATAMMDSVYVLAKMVGMDTNAYLATTKKRQFNNHEIKPQTTPNKKPQISKSRGTPSSAQEIFPLNEDDLKEF